MESAQLSEAGAMAFNRVRSVPKRSRNMTLALLASLAQPADLVLLICPVAVLLMVNAHASDIRPAELTVATAAAAAVAAAWLARTRRYDLPEFARRSQLGWTNIAIACGLGAIILHLCLALLLPQLRGSLLLWKDPLCWALSAVLLLCGANAGWARLLAKARANGLLQRRVVIVGDPDRTAALATRIASDAASELAVVAQVRDGGQHAAASCSHPEPPLQHLVDRCRELQAEAVLLAVPLTQPERIADLSQALGSLAVDVGIVPELPSAMTACEVRQIGRNIVLGVGRRPLNDGQWLQKSIFDLIVASLLVLLLAPFLALVALLIRLDSPGPILFRQPRLGFNNNVFLVLKFRTMTHAEDAASLNGSAQARLNDPRVTRVGKWLRKLSLDELPQLVNVLRGEMSLVGPRPHPLRTSVDGRLFQEVVRDYAARHRVLPGITGWAQVNGWRGETVRLEQIERRVEHDLFYIENWSLALDIRILLLTVAREIVSKHAF